MRRVIFLLLIFAGLYIKSFGFGYKSSVPANGFELESIQDIVITFDFGDVNSSNDSDTDWHIGCNVWNNKPVVALMCGNEILSQIYRNDDLEAGDSFTIKFDNPIILSSGVEYKLVVGEGAFSLYEKGDFDGYVTDSEAFELQFYGSGGESEILTLETTIPANNSAIADFSVVELVFNEDVELIADKASLYEENESNPLVEVKLSIGDTNNVVLATLDNPIIFYKDHNYHLEIPENSIIYKGDPNKSYKMIVLDYTGISYKYFGYGRISPGNNKSIEYLGVVTVPVDCSETEYLGRDFKVLANLYKVDGEEKELVGDPIQCVVAEDSKSFYINAYNFDLQPESDYQLVVATDQFCLWNQETQRPMRDTANEELVLNYHTPEVIDPLPAQQFGAATPVSGSSSDKLESFKLMLEPYSFEDVDYYPVFASYGEGYNVLKVIDEASGEETASFEVDIKWDDDNNYWIENLNPIDIVLLDNHTYTVVVPAGMFCCYFEPLHNVSLNKEYVVTYKGSYATSFAVNCNFGDAFTLTSAVNRGETATLKFSPADDWAIDEVTVNEEAATVEDNTLVIADVNEEMNVYVTYKYVGEISFDYETGIDNVMAECPYGVAVESGYVIISNVEMGASIDVYNTVGMLMANSTATQPTMKLSVNPGIVVVVIRNADNKPVGITVKVP